MNCRGACPVPFVDWRRITRLNDLFDSCFLNSGLIFWTAVYRLHPHHGKPVGAAEAQSTIQALFCRRRHQPRRPVPARIRPGKASAGDGGGDKSTECDLRVDAGCGPASPLEPNTVLRLWGVEGETGGFKCLL
jgi:hypothetical protein